MLSYTDLQSDEFLSKAIKKAYLESLGSEIKEMIQTIESQCAKIQQLEGNQKALEQEIEARDAQLNTPEHKVALAIKEMMHAEALGTVVTETPSIVRSQVTKHLAIDIDTCGYYEDGAKRYDSDATVEWR
mgnify:FL=1